MTATIQKMDDSYIVRLPATIMENVKVRESDVVQIYEEHGRIIIQKPTLAAIVNDSPRKSSDELFKGLEALSNSSTDFWDNEIDDEVWNDI